MAAVTAKMVKDLREMTGAGMMDCKKALTETDGDKDKAVEYLREKGLATAAKKSGRIAAEGLVYTKIDEAKKVGVVVEINVETDFAAKTDRFIEFVELVANTIIDNDVADVDALKEVVPAGQTEKIADILTERIATIGENIQIRRFKLMEGACVAYVHAGGVIGVLVNFKTDLADKPEFVTYGKDVAMQIAALNTPYLKESDVPAEVLEHEKEIMKAEVVNSGKPEAIADKIVMGKIGKFYKENCLLDQAFVKENKISVQTTQLKNLVVLSKLLNSFVLKRAKALKSVKTTLQLKLQQ